MRKRIIILLFLLLLICFVSYITYIDKTVMPNTLINNIPVVQDMNLSMNGYDIINSISVTAYVSSETEQDKVTIYEENNEFRLVYGIVKDNDKRLLEYESCEGVIRLGYIEGADIYSESNYIPAEVIVRRLALYRLISLAKGYGADALFEPTIITVATYDNKTLIYKTEATAKLIKK